MSTNSIFAQKITKIWTGQISQNKKNTLYIEQEQPHGQIVSNLQPTFSKKKKRKKYNRREKKCSFVLLRDKKKQLF